MCTLPSRLEIAGDVVLTLKVNKAVYRDLPIERSCTSFFELARTLMPIGMDGGAYGRYNL
jgi:hypothetical protein